MSSPLGSSSRHSVQASAVHSREPRDTRAPSLRVLGVARFVAHKRTEQVPVLQRTPQLISQIVSVVSQTLAISSLAALTFFVQSVASDRVIRRRACLRHLSTSCNHH